MKDEDCTKFWVQAGLPPASERTLRRWGYFNTLYFNVHVDAVWFATFRWLIENESPTSAQSFFLCVLCAWSGWILFR